MAFHFAEKLKPDFSDIPVLPDFATQPEAETGTVTADVMSPLRTAQAIAAQATPKNLKRAVGAVSMPVVMRITESFSITEYGARLNDGVTYGQQITDACAAANADGKSVDIPAGVLRTSATLLSDKTADTGFTTASKRPSFLGAGPGSTFLVYEGNTSAVKIVGGHNAPFGGHESHQHLSNLTLVGSNFGESIGLELDHVAWLGLENVQITGFDWVIKGIDVEYLRANNCVFRFNKRGPYITTRYAPDPNSSNPNGHSYVACSFASQREFGLFYDRANCLTIIGGDIQYCGVGRTFAPGWGLRVDNAGLQGGVGLTIHGTYVEHNAGVADIWLRQTDPAHAPYNASAYDIQADFKRALDYTNPAIGRTDHFIALDFLTASGPQAVTVRGSTFKNYNGNVFITDTVGFLGQKKRKDIDLIVDGNVYNGGEGIPEYVGYTPTFGTTLSSSGLVISGQTGRWRKRGKLVRAEGSFTVSAVGSSTGLLVINLPFTPAGAPALTTATVQNATSVSPAYGAISGGDPFIRTPLPAVGATIVFSAEYEMA